MKTANTLSLSKDIRARCEQTLDELSELIVNTCEQYVPYRTGRLMRSAHVEKKTSAHSNIVYSVPYAHDCYYSEFPFNKKRHPLATSHWFEAGKNAYLNDWCKSVADNLLK